MPFENLPGIFDIRTDGNLSITPINENPIVLVIGTADSGPSENFFTVGRINDAARTFGRSGTLTRGLFEVASTGAQNIRLYRIGATSAKLTLVGGGITIETVQKDNTAGKDFKIFWEDSTDRLRVWRVTDDTLVYDNNPVYPSLLIDLGEVIVSGTVSGNPGSIGTLSVPITLEASHAISGAVYAAGTDGTALSRMRLFEEFYNAYELLENQAADFIVPMDVYQDDLNCMDLTDAQIISLGLHLLTTYPTSGASNDALGKVYVQEYQGKNYFWWDTDRDGLAEIFPTVGSASATLNADGVALVVADFHEANFGYQLANFCFTMSQDSAEMLGFIGVKPPLSFGLQDIAKWVGTSPITTTDLTNGIVSVTTNGTGLLGNKWHAGRKNVPGGLPGHTIGGIVGLSGGGYIGTLTKWSDSEHQKDRNNRLIDIGKYISVAVSPVIYSTSFQANAYVATSASGYGGFVSGLAAASAPTNKVMPGIRLVYRVKNSFLDDLAGLGFVSLQGKPKGIVVADAPTASRVVSDYRRLTTMRIVKATIDAIRGAGDPFLGEPITGARLAALETALDQTLSRLQKSGILQRFEFSVLSTASQRVQGKATVELKLVPAFELRQITVNVSLAAS
jgi:hypothetical protein